VELPSPDALAAAQALARRNHGRAAQVRRLFVERDNTTRPTPLALTLRGGRGGQVRLKTYLSMLWLAAAPPHDASYPARAWATLLDLPDPSGNGARRVNDAIAWLGKHNFLDIEFRPGHPNRVTLLDESGDDSRGRYRVPGAAYNKAKARKADVDVLAKHRYVQLPATFWTSGWLAVLSGPAVAMYLVLLAEQAGHPEGRELWFSPDAARLRYVLSEDTRSRGLDELRRAGLVAVRRRPVATDIFDVQRFRNVYVLKPERLAESAQVPDRRGDDVIEIAPRRVRLPRKRPPGGTSPAAPRRRSG
jgi:hypothetical protein